MTRSAVIDPTGFARCWRTTGLANASDDEGQTPLHRLHGALTHGTEIIDLLVQHHADVNARDRRGVSVLANVMASGAADLADRLRSLGAKPEAKELDPYRCP